MKTGSEFHVGIVGLGSMGMGAALSCVRAGLSTGADLNSNACATLKEAGACGVSDNAATFAENWTLCWCWWSMRPGLNRCCLVKRRCTTSETRYGSNGFFHYRQC